MDFRTKIVPERSDLRINYKTPLFFIGSCFANEIGKYLVSGKHNTTINPFGVLYNPESVADALEILIENKKFTAKDLYCYKEKYLSFNHDTSFSSDSEVKVLKKINNSIDEASTRLLESDILFVTFGTARVFRFGKSGKIVSNCHKVPANEFTRELLEVDQIVDRWTTLLAKIKEVKDDLHIVFTVSPVRHWKDGAHGNQVSKSLLFVAIDKLIAENRNMSYFPSYELLMDDLRDYRYYNDDLLHPSSRAIEYIWEYFTKHYFDRDTLDTYNEVSKLTKATRHKIVDENAEEVNMFKNGMISRIELLSKKYPFIDFSEEHKYFLDLS